MSDIIGGENHFPLGFGSTDRTFDLDFSAGDSAFGLDFGAAIIGGGSLLPDGGEAGDVLTLAPVLHGDPKPTWLSPQYPAFFNFRLDSDDNVVQGPTWAEVLAVPPEIVVIAIVSTPNGAEKRELRCIRRQDVNYYHPVTIQFSAAIGDATYDIVNGETNDSWLFEEESIDGVIDDNIIAFSDAVIGDLADLDTSDQSNLVAAINEVAGRYEKPETGIPKSDLASDVQTSLGKADAALPTTGNAYRAASIPMGQLDSSSTATDMTATVPGITELRDGVCMWLKNGVISSASGVTLNINNLGAKPLYSSLAAATRSTTIFSSAYTLLFIYNSTRVDGGCWDVVYGIDTNTNTIGYQLRTNSATMPMASVVYRYRLLFTSADGTHLVPANNSTSTNATSSRTVCQTPIDPFGTIYYYGATASVAADSNPGAASLWTRYVITLGYSFNRTGAALVLTPNVPVYIKCAPQTDGSAIIDATSPYVQTLPSTEDGKIYILLGIAASATTVEIQENHPVYCCRKNSIRKWTGVEAELDALYEMIENLEPAEDDVPSYVKAEALSVVGRVQPHLQNDSIVFIAGSDSHQSDTEHVADGNLHGGMAMRSLAKILPVDFATYLGDYTTGSATTTLAEGRAHFAEINADIDPAFRNLPQFRTVGNHDPLGYSYNQNGEGLSQAELYQYIGKYNEDSGATMGSTVSGYCYRDFPAKNLRVICLNTADETPSAQGGTEVVSAAQKTWFADTLISTPQGYGIIILSHHPLDWGNIMSVSHILRAYVEEQASINIGGTTYSFTNKNKSAWVLQFHGHVHTFTVDDLHWNNGGTGTPYEVKRVAVPNLCFVRNNEYGRNSGTEYYGIEFGTATTYNKTADSGQDTAWNVIVVNPSEKTVYAINYGAGIDRTVSFDYSKTFYPINATLDHVTLTGDSQIEAGTAYNGVLTVATGYEMASVSVMMGGTNITSSAYNASTGEITIAAVTAAVQITATATIILPYHNLVPTSVDETGAIYNGIGYKTGYRLNTSGTETASSPSVCCGYIPYAGEVVRIASMAAAGHINYTGNYVNFYDANKAYIRAVPGTAVCMSEANKVITLDPQAETNATIKADILRASYIRASLSDYTAPASSFTVTLDEII